MRLNHYVKFNIILPMERNFTLFCLVIAGIFACLAVKFWLSCSLIVSVPASAFFGMGALLYVGLAILCSRKDMPDIA